MITYPVGFAVVGRYLQIKEKYVLCSNSVMIMNAVLIIVIAFF